MMVTLTAAVPAVIHAGPRQLTGPLLHCASLCRQFAAGEQTHAMLAFEFAGGWNDVKGSVAVTVLQFLLGGGGSFSAGGPGAAIRYPVGETCCLKPGTFSVAGV